ncbi:MAG TPA: TRAP transporter small permease [Geminicoccus sp.]|jgi:TRAP-type C4-dicarboxylate transport system permease small subunit|uniref:TRAP transporter small permease n=1 Tax=Geminicoccus sp. TaxID=2024832 RepID=UPI002E32C967|nr:TRAP transporter small permease [Geminicoccus sp.]HEX2529060.1 TRAP transporter small permease [Geminicoccus sp.]
MIKRLWAAVEWATEALLILSIVAMTVMCLAQVGWRYLLGDPLIWSEEAARYLFVWVAYLSGWLAWKHRAHVAVDIVHYLGGPLVRKASEALVEAVVLIFCLYTFYTNLGLLRLTTGQPSATLGLPMVWVYAGYSVMALLIAGDIVVGRLSGGRLARDPVEEVQAS